MKALLKFVAKSALNVVTGGFGGDFLEMCQDIWSNWGKGRSEQQRKADLEALVQAPPAEVQRQVREVVREVAKDQSPQVQFQLESYLNQVPTATRQSLRRRDDPHGRTVPPSMPLTKAEDLATVLPRLPRFKPGDRPLGHIVDWELVKLLGVGGFGEVWRACNPNAPHLQAALKFCLDPAAQQLLKYEAAVLARVMGQGKQSGIVELRHTYLGADPPCLEYEFIKGGDLASTVHNHQAATKEQLAPRQATKIVLDLARAVGRVHKLSPPIVHRDLKPANVLVRQTGDKTEFLITDFGIGGVAANQALEQTRQGTTSTPMLTSLKGSHTPLYASPEQKSGELPDPRDDVHALGVIWYQLLIGDFSAEPHAGDTWKEQLRDRGVSDKLLKVLVSCFEPRVFRPDNAAVLAERIEAILAAEKLDKAEQEKAVKEKAERDKAEKERIEKEKAARAQAEQERLEREKAEREKAERERIERERDEKEKNPLVQASAALDRADFGAAIAACNQALKADPPLIEAYRLRARAYAGKNKLDDALKDLNAVVASAEATSADLVERGQLFAEQGKPDKAVKDFTEALTRDRGSFDAYVARARAYVTAESWELAFADFDAALKIAPQAAAVYFHRGEAHAQRKEYDRAIADYSEAIRLEPTQARFFNARGLARYRKGEIDLALADLISALHLNPALGEAYYSRGQVYARKENHQQAVADYTEAIQRGVKPGRIFYLRGLSYARLHKPTQAIADFTKAIKASPRNPELYLMRGLAYSEKADYASAVADFTKAIHRDKKYTAAYQNRGRAYLESGKHGKAIKDFSQVLQFSPRRADAFEGRACAYCLKKRYDEAIADATEAVRLNPTCSSAYAHRSRAHAGKGNLDEAVTDATEAIKLDPQAAHYEARGLARYGRSEYDLAIADLTEAIKLAPKNGALYRDRSRAYAKLGDTKKAEADRKKAKHFGVSLGRERKEKTSAGQGATLADIIAAGLLSPPLRLFRRYKGTMLEATLLAGGMVEFQGQRYDSCSAAAEAARATVAGKKMNTNGWDFWQYQGADRKRHKLDAARQQLASPLRGQTPAPKKEQPADATVGARIRSKALELLSARPEGIRYAKLVRAIHDAFPYIPVNTIHGTIWDLDKVLPEDVCKPARGLFKATKFRGTGAEADRGRELVNSLGMKFVLIPAGKFLMGSPDSEEGREEDEGPQHEVELTHPFYLGIHPVTQKQYKQVMGKNPSQFTHTNGGGAKHPVEQISWEEAVEFCCRLSALTEEKAAGRAYRLPTEAEWEYACRGRANSPSPFSFGDSLSSAQANFNGNNPYGGAAAGEYLHRTTPVGSFQPNAFGLFDMHGNVWEWCQDWYDENYYSQSPRQDPQGPPKGESRVIRGGGCFDDGHGCRSAVRDSGEPDAHRGHIGFRVVCVVPQSS
jgi:formylglycine-generating enzyme required for sulfatase activity/tetratricopeptide (TPR) repeat protein